MRIWRNRIVYFSKISTCIFLCVSVYLHQKQGGHPGKDGNPMKLTKEQERVMNEAKADIDFARGHTFLEWYKANIYPYESRNNMYEDSWYLQKMSEDPARYERLNWWYENEKKGRVLTHRCNSRTLYKLEAYGLIRIETDGKDTNSPLDTIWVLNY